MRTACPVNKPFPSGLNATLFTAAAVSMILSVCPLRSRRTGGQHHDQIVGAVHGVDDLAPQVRIGGHVGGIPKHTQRIQLAHPATDAVQALLDSGGHGPIVVVVGQKGVVGERRSLTPSRRLGGYRGRAAGDDRGRHWHRTRGSTLVQAQDVVTEANFWMYPNFLG